ncbi:Ail/Lom family outer membrane beta-barrel protein [Leclercia pneumoniae]|uniref:Ail/Lom family outer membrane beta-barrel protein n=1 Tax=Leclercia pneumoniae TaxID=2815358 RepID=UPI003AF8F58D
MKKLSLALLVASTLMSGTALANNHTVSIGYAQSDFENLGDIHGVNVQYRYEWDSPFSVMGSFTYLTGDNSDSEYEAGETWSYKDDIKYYSLLAGPVYRINDYVSVYALGGVSYIKWDGETRWDYDWGYSERDKTSENSTQFAWGAGVQFNPTDDFSIGIGYEGTTAKYYESYSVNGFNLTVGYRF